jgi:hypothetical protein
VISGIAGTAVKRNAVVVNSTGKVGVATSSARFKKAIKPMDKASEAILAAPEEADRSFNCNCAESERPTATEQSQLASRG